MELSQAGYVNVSPLQCIDPLNLEYRRSAQPHVGVNLRVTIGSIWPFSLCRVLYLCSCGQRENGRSILP